MHQSVLDFTQAALQIVPCLQARVLEVGSYDVNGSVRPLIEAYGCASYVGTDMRPGPRVDVVADCCELGMYWPQSFFDLVVSAEMLEHVQDWRRAVDSMKAAVCERGYILLTTRSHGFPLHDFPADYWRFELADLSAIFADFEQVLLRADLQAPGAFILVRKPRGWSNGWNLNLINVRSMHP